MKHQNISIGQNWNIDKKLSKKFSLRDQVKNHLPPRWPSGSCWRCWQSSTWRSSAPPWSPLACPSSLDIGRLTYWGKKRFSKYENKFQDWIHPHLFPWLLPLIQMSLTGSIWWAMNYRSSIWWAMNTYTTIWWAINNSSNIWWAMNTHTNIWWAMNSFNK